MGSLVRHHKRFSHSEKEFWSDSTEIQLARQAIYKATDLDIAYVLYDEPDPLIIGDLTKFASMCSFEKVAERTFYQLIKPTY